MGFGSYFRTKKAPAASGAEGQATQMTEKSTMSSSAGGPLGPVRPGPLSSRPASIRSSYAASTHSHGSAYLDSMRHEIMVSYLYQQQCANLWIMDSSGTREGVMLRKSRDNYLACPPALADSPFARACAQFNVLVSHFLLPQLRKKTSQWKFENVCAGYFRNFEFISASLLWAVL